MERVDRCFLPVFSRYLRSPPGYKARYFFCNLALFARNWPGMIGILGEITSALLNRRRQRAGNKLIFTNIGKNVRQHSAKHNINQSFNNYVSLIYLILMDFIFLIFHARFFIFTSIVGESIYSVLYASTLSAICQPPVQHRKRYRSQP